MTSTVLQRPIQAKAEKKASKAASSTRSRSTMAWSNEKLRFSCIDNIGLKQLWKLIALDTSAPSKQHNAMMLDVEQQQQQQKQQQSNNNNEVSGRKKRKLVRPKQTHRGSDVNEDWGNASTSA